MLVLLAVLLVCGLVLALLREPRPLDPIPVLMARSAATTGRMGDVAIVTLARGNRGPLVTCSCPAERAEVLFAGSLDDCRLFATAYNAEVRRLWEGAVHDD
jgi:hypothetical protein